MNIKIIIIFLVCPLMLFSQEKYEFKAVYNLSYSLDSKVKNNEKFVLFFGANNSYFLSDKLLKSDSIITAKNDNPNSQLTTVSNILTYFNDRIIKNSENTSIFIKKDNSAFFYNENDQLFWKITNDSKVVKNLKCTVAETQAFGRDWVACFSVEYAFPIGPYKFFGLPGLIIQIESKDGAYIYSLEELIKGKSDIKDTFLRSTLVSKEKYFEVINQLKYGDGLFHNINFQDPTFLEKIKKKRRDRREREYDFPIDKDMRYIFK